MPTAVSETVDAGPFGKWLAAMRAVLRGERDADVPCGDCIGCCVSSYPIPLRPTDARARAEVPEQFLLGRAAAGERWLMGFREDGHCPFMHQRLCGIYADRPQTCRDYDCRIYAAAGLLPDGSRPVIERRVRAWVFTFASEAERAEAEALRQLAGLIRINAQRFPASVRAGSATAAAVLALKAQAMWSAPDPAALPPADLAQQVLDAVRAFDARAAQPRD